MVLLVHMKGLKYHDLKVFFHQNLQLQTSIVTISFSFNKTQVHTVALRLLDGIRQRRAEPPDAGDFSRNPDVSSNSSTYLLQLSHKHEETENYVSMAGLLGMFARTLFAVSPFMMFKFPARLQSSCQKGGVETKVVKICRR